MTQPRPELYQSGGTLSAGVQTYVEREADSRLFEALRSHHFCYVLTARQMGKSSLMVRTQRRLQDEGVASVIFDLTLMGKGTTQQQWYRGHADEIAQALDLPDSWEDWWHEQDDVGDVQRFARFLTDYVLDQIVGDLVIFIDEIDSTIGLPFSDDYFALIRALHNRRAQDPRLQRLTFALLGVAAPADLIKDAQRTPFNIGRRIDLTDFTLAEASPLMQGLAPDPELARKLLDRVFFWTGGHPYLSQRTCEAVATWAQRDWDPLMVPGIVDETIKSVFLSAGRRTADPNLQVVAMRVGGRSDAGESTQMLATYRQILRGLRVPDEDLDPIKIDLKLSGLVVPGPSGLRVRNRIYETVFDDAWVQSLTNDATVEALTDAEPQHDVFVSYSFQDREWVAGFLVPSLQAAGLDVASDLKLLPGDDWEQILPRLRETSRFFVPVLSPAWARSRGAQEEFALMSNRVGKIVPVLLRPTELPTFLRNIQFADFTDPAGQDEAMRRLVAALGGNAGAVVLPAPAPDTSGTAEGDLEHRIAGRFDREQLIRLVSARFEQILEGIDADASQEAIAARLVSFARRNQRIGELRDLIDAGPVQALASSPASSSPGIGLRTAFVVMPFGTKHSASGELIDFNRVYNELIRPALQEAGFNPARADDEIQPGDIRSDAMQTMVMADVVLADISIDNANVWYQLGVRHSLRARGVVVLQAKTDSARSAFDIYTDRRFNYGVIDSAPNPRTLRDNIRELAITVGEASLGLRSRRITSPIYQLFPHLVEPDWKSLLMGDRETPFAAALIELRQRIDVARRVGRAGDILVLADECPFEALCAEALCAAAEALLKGECFDFALEQCERCLAIDPVHQRARRLKGLCLQRLGRLEEAREHFRSVISDHPDDPEAWAMLGRLDKDAWTAMWRHAGGTQAQMREAATREAALLRNAIDSYAKGYRRNPSHYYSGLTVLTLMRLYHDLTADARYETEMEAMAGAVRFAALSETNVDFWQKAVLGDLEVLAGTPDTVKRAYNDAIASNRRDWFALISIRAQLQLLKDLGFHPENVDAGIVLFDRALRELAQPADRWRPHRVFLFSSQRIDAPGRPLARFAAHRERAAAQAIADLLSKLDVDAEDLALCTGASGGDLIFAEACLTRGMKLEVRIPTDESEFVDRFVAPAGEGWRDRFYRVKSNPQTRLFVMPAELGTAPATDAFRRNNLWQFYTALAMGSSRCHFISLWDEEDDGVKGGTRDLMNEIKGRGGRVTKIDVGKLS